MILAIATIVLMGGIFLLVAPRDKQERVPIRVRVRDDRREPPRH